MHRQLIGEKHQIPASRVRNGLEQNPSTVSLDSQTPDDPARRFNAVVEANLLQSQKKSCQTGAQVSS